MSDGSMSFASRFEQLPSKESPMRIAILDDYQSVAQKMADWSPLEGKAEIRSSATTSPMRMPWRSVSRHSTSSASCASEHRCGGASSRDCRS